MPHPTQMWLCLPRPSSPPPRTGAWPSVRVIMGLPLLKVPAFSFESITDSFFILPFLYFFKEPCNFFFFLPPPPSYESSKPLLGVVGLSNQLTC